ncbi:MAG: hypothetical protein QGH99_06145, partial [Pseudomonadales bacterium]|nr:hypothetical protein [Pseudomonadales bacterium]
MIRRLFPAIPFLVLASCSTTDKQEPNPSTELNPDWVVTADEAYQWASVKNDNLPTLTGSPEWQNYMSFLESKLTEYGTVD